MGCYTVPASAAIIHSILRRKYPALKFDKYHRWLNQLLVGGAIFGIVDHIWNRELLRFSVSDVVLGFVISAAIVIVWGIMVLVDARTTKQPNEAGA